MSEYPSEPGWWTAVHVPRVIDAYARVGRTFPDDPQGFYWFTRPAYDIGAGRLSKEAASNGHIEGLCDALGLAPDNRPTPLPISPLLPLRPSGTMFCTDAGPLFLKGASCFHGFQTFLDAGEDPLLTPLAQLQDLGCRMVLTWGMDANLNQFAFGTLPFDPRNYGDAYYQGLPAFKALAARFGLYVYLCGYPDVGLIMPDVGTQLAHHSQLMQAINAGGTDLFVLQNEAASKAYNCVANFRAMLKPSVPSCGGSYSSDDPAYHLGVIPQGGPDWDFGDLHPVRDYPAHILDCCPAKNLYWMNARPLLIGEPDRYGSSGNPNADLARLSAAASTAGAAGFVFHSMCGEKAVELDADTLRCARAAFGAMAAV